MVRQSLAVILLLACASCGIKGPLVLPPATPPTVAPPAAVPPVEPGPSSPPPVAAPVDKKQ